MNLKGVDFSETQQLHIVVRMACVISVIAILIGAYISLQLEANQPQDELWAMLLGLMISVILLVYVFLFRLETSINTSGIKVNCWPVKKDLPWFQISSLDVLNYGFIGGWGIRLWTKHGTVYNAKGKMGLAVQLKNGKRYIIGTQKENELKKNVEKWKNTSS